jgi:hypothetical protein
MPRCIIDRQLALGREMSSNGVTVMITAAAKQLIRQGR